MIITTSLHAEETHAAREACCVIGSGSAADFAGMAFRPGITGMTAGAGSVSGVDRTGTGIATGAGGRSWATLALNCFPDLKTMDAARLWCLHRYAHLVPTYIDNGDQNVR